jgi:murein DD-endopeptidase MepM/ murein hydrolase activator NlpD
MSTDRSYRRPHRWTNLWSVTVRYLAILVALWIFLAVTGPNAGAQTSGDVDHAESDRDTAYEQVQMVQNQVERALIEYDRAHTELEDVEERVELTRRQLDTYRTESEDLDALVLEGIIEAYVSTGSTDAKIALGARTFQDLVLARYLGDQLRGKQQIDLNRLLVVSREVDRLREKLESERTTMSDLAAVAQDAAERVQVSLESAQHVLVDAERDYQGIKAEYEESQRKKREAELTRIRNNTNSSVRGLPPEATEGFVCPVQGGAAFINSWGFPRSGGRTHKGVDMFAARGTPTPAVTSGTVKIRTVNLGGAVTYLYGDDGNKYYYAHLNGYPDGLRDGQRVSRGQAIGFVGNSGNAEGTSPHLHFEIRPGGSSAVNPYPTVRPACP